jgi:predicted transposase YbfD/YdcC
MSSIKIRRQAATPKGFLRRLQDARFDLVEEPRVPTRVQHKLEPTLKLAVLSLVTGARSTRALEDRSEQLRSQVRSDIGLEARISDNAFGMLLPRLGQHELRRALRAQVKAEWGRGNLAPVHLPRSTVAIDGKHLATIDEKRLRDLISQMTPLDGHELDAMQLRIVLETRLPWVQLHETEQGLHGLVRAHRMTLISSQAAVVLDQQPIMGKTNELGTIMQTLGSLFSHYGKSRMVELVTMDAGNTTQAAAAYIASQCADYFLAVRSPQGTIFELAEQQLSSKSGVQAIFRYYEECRGQSICYTVWRYDLPNGQPGYASARQLFRIERVAAGENATSVGNRYFVSSMDADKMDGEQAYRLARAHWRCENEGHWTADAIWDEDARRTPWTTHPNGVLVVGLLRSMAINILSVLRALSRIRREGKFAKPAWKTVIEHALLVLCDVLLDTEVFDACDG